MSILFKIKQQSDTKKRVLSFILATALTLIIIVVWFSFSQNSKKQANTENSSQLSSISPLQMIKDEFTKAMSNFNETAMDYESEISTSTATSTNTEDTVTIEIVEEENEE